MTNSSDRVDQPLVSVIIPAFNRATLIGETLDSVIAQSYTHWECIVVDDGSTDNTIQVIEEYCVQDKRFALYKRDREPKGAPTCRNIGFSKSEGEFINFFDSDDIMHRDFLSIKMQAIKDYNVDFVVCQATSFSGPYNESKESLKEAANRIESKIPFIDHLTAQIAFYTPGPLWKRELLNDDFFDETNMLLQDWDAFNKILIKNINYKAINTPLVHRRQHNERISQPIQDYSDAKFLNLLKIRKSNFLRATSNPQIINQISDFFLIIATQYLLISYKSKNYKLQIRIISFMLLIVRKDFSQVFNFIKLIIGSLTVTLFNKGHRLITIKTYKQPDFPV